MEKEKTRSQGIGRFISMQCSRECVCALMCVLVTVTHYRVSIIWYPKETTTVELEGAGHLGMKKAGAGVRRKFSPHSDLD